MFVRELARETRSFDAVCEMHIDGCFDEYGFDVDERKRNN